MQGLGSERPKEHFLLDNRSTRLLLLGSTRRVARVLIGASGCLGGPDGTPDVQTRGLHWLLETKEQREVDT